MRSLLFWVQYQNVANEFAKLRKLIIPVQKLRNMFGKLWEATLRLEILLETSGRKLGSVLVLRGLTGADLSDPYSYHNDGIINIISLKYQSYELTLLSIFKDYENLKIHLLLCVVLFFPMLVLESETYWPITSQLPFFLLYIYLYSIFQAVELILSHLVNSALYHYVTDNVSSNCPSGTQKNGVDTGEWDFEQNYSALVKTLGMESFALT